MKQEQDARVGILEDDDDMRGYLCMIIRQTEGLQIGFSAATVAEACALCRNNPVDICLVDLQLPDGSGLEFVENIKAISDPKILILTVLGDRTSVLVSLQAGANGYLLKDTPPNQIRRDIKATLDGANPISPQAATHVLQMFKNSPDLTATPKPKTLLTEREKEILVMFSKGLSYRETAEVLSISHHTVCDYVKAIYSKLKVHSRNEAIFEATQMGWINPIV